jgi:acyl dehydratase
LEKIEDIIYYEDFPIDEQIESTESFTLDRESIIEFAQSWDPRPFHLSEEGAAGTPMGALCASGVQTLAIAIKLVNTTKYYYLSVICALSLDNFCLHKPVYVGDELRVRIKLTSKRESRSRAGCGIMTIHVDVIKQDKERVASFDNIILINRRGNA